MSSRRQISENLPDNESDEQTLEAEPDNDNNNDHQENITLLTPGFPNDELQSPDFGNIPENIPPSNNSNDGPVLTYSRTNPDSSAIPSGCMASETQSSQKDDHRRNEYSGRIVQTLLQTVRELSPNETFVDILTGLFNEFGPFFPSTNSSRQANKASNSSQKARDQAFTKNKSCLGGMQSGNCNSSLESNEVCLNNSNAENAATLNESDSNLHTSVLQPSLRTSDSEHGIENMPPQLENNSSRNNTISSSNNASSNQCTDNSGETANARQSHTETQQYRIVQTDRETGLSKVLDKLFNVAFSVMRSRTGNKCNETSDVNVRSGSQNDKGYSIAIPKLDIDFDFLLSQHKEAFNSYISNDILSSIIQKNYMFDTLNRMLPLILNFTRTIDVIPRGGISDPCVLMEFYQNNPACYMTEMDLMYCFGTLPYDINFITQSNKINHVNLIRKDHFLDHLNEEFRSFTENNFAGEIVDSEKFTKEATKFRNYLSRKQKFPLKRWAKELEVYFNDNTDFAPYEYIGGDESTFASQFNIGETPCHVVVNHIPCLKLNFWPDQAKEWMMREADWPTFDQRQLIMSKGCHIIPSSMCDITGHVTGKEQQTWKLDFILAEKEILIMLSRAQKNVLYLMLVLYHKYLRSIGEKQKGCASIKGLSKRKPVFSPYHITTTVFWVCEQHPQHEKDSNGNLYWSEENTLSNLQECLNKLEVFLNNGFLPHYFVTKQNLLDGVERNVLEIAIEKLQRMKQHLLFYIPYNMKDMYDIFVKHDLYKNIAWVIAITILNGYALHGKLSVSFNDIELD